MTTRAMGGVCEAHSLATRRMALPARRARRVRAARRAPRRARSSCHARDALRRRRVRGHPRRPRSRRLRRRRRRRRWPPKPPEHRARRPPLRVPPFTPTPTSSPAWTSTPRSASTSTCSLSSHPPPLGIFSAGVLLVSQLWERVWKERVFPDEAAAAEKPPTVLCGVDCSAYPVFSEAKVVRAAAFAERWHHGQFRRSGEPYVTHSIEAAVILAAMLPRERVRAEIRRRDRRVHPSRRCR